MRKSAILLLSLALASGCALKEMQRPDLVGDSRTKLFYKNVPTNEAKIPQGQRTYFKDMDAATAEGYKSAQEGATGASDTQSGE